MDFAAAKEYLEGRLNMPTNMTSRVISEEIPARVRAHCFFSARVAEGNVLERLRAVSDAYGKGEIDLATARMRFKQWYDQAKPGRRFADEEKLTNIASTMRLNLVMRQNAAMAAAVGRYQVSRDPEVEERWPCWRYITGPNPRPEHLALDGRVFLKSDPVWQKVYPPWEFNCNCDVEDAELPEKGADTIRAEDVPESLDGFRFDPAEAFREFDSSQFEAGWRREGTHEALVEFCAENNAATTVVAKGDGRGADDGGLLRFARGATDGGKGADGGGAVAKTRDGNNIWALLTGPSASRKDEIRKQIDEWVARIPKDAQGRSDASGMSRESIDLGQMLEIHRVSLGISPEDGQIRLSIPGGLDFGVKHWLINHEDTLTGETVIDLLERTIWNDSVAPREEIRGSKRRLVYEAKGKDKNVSTVLFELIDDWQAGKRHWELVDSWEPSDEYMDRGQKNDRRHPELNRNLPTPPKRRTLQ